MVGSLHKLIVSAVVLLASAMQVQAGIITYELKFSNATLYDYNGDDIGTYSGGFTVETSSPITSAGLFQITSSFLSLEAETLYNVVLDQQFDPNGFNTGKNFVGFSTENDNMMGSGTGFLFFESDAFITNGVHHLVTGTITDGNGGFYGNFVQDATLTVSGINSVPEPSSIAIFGLFGLAAWRVSRKKSKPADKQ